MTRRAGGLRRRGGLGDDPRQQLRRHHDALHHGPAPAHPREGPLSARDAGHGIRSVSRSAGRHKRLFDVRFPMLRNVELAHTWSGFVALTRNTAPGFGRVRGGVHAACCQNGVGVAKGTIAGILAADLACGREQSAARGYRGAGQALAASADTGARARRAGASGVGALAVAVRGMRSEQQTETGGLTWRRSWKANG